MLRIGLIGAGGMGWYHAKNIASLGNARIAGIYEPDAGRRGEAVKVADGARVFGSPESLIGDPEIDAVLVCSPDATHAALVNECLSVKKPVLCEKPLAAERGDIEGIIARENALGKKYIAVGFNRRFDPSHAEVYRQLRSGSLGKPLLWKGVHRNASAMYNTQGPFILMNSAGHDIDSARWLLQSDVRAVSVKGRASRETLPAGSRDCLLVTMEMANGTLACAEVYVNCAYGYEVIAEVVCQTGTVTTLKDGLALRRQQGNRGVSVSDDFRACFALSYALEAEAWIQSVRGGHPFPGADAWDGYAAVAGALACGESLTEQKEVTVTMMAKPDLYIREEHELSG
ncbi:MAG: Gfo/Idh/MocA family oxidoreductase [Treponema sp.]|nr:Gfo/Idh/MocA family oxidoreductase [Treponema sp.]